MGTDVTRNDTPLPIDVNKVVQAGQRSQAAASAIPTGDAFGEFHQEDGWVFGQEKIQVEEGSLWTTLVGAIRKGFISWHGPGVRPDEETLPWVDGGFPEENLPASADPWLPMWVLPAQCLTGEDKDQKSLFKGNSLGMDRAMTPFTAEIGGKFMEIQDGAHPVEFCNPVFVLERGNTYQNRQGKTIHNPAIRIVGWCNHEGELYGESAKLAAPKKAEPEPEQEVAPQPAAQRRRRRKAS